MNKKRITETTLDSTTDWDLNSVISNLSSADFNTNTHQEDDFNDNVTTDLSAEIIATIEEPCPKTSTLMTVRFAEMQRVVLVKRRQKGPDHRKMGHRQIPNPWRRFGSLKTLHGVGGWANPRGKGKELHLIKPGAPISKDPKNCHLSLHQDRAVLKQDFFKFKLNPSADSQAVAYSVGLQIAEHCQSILRLKELPQKPTRNFANSKRK